MAGHRRFHRFLLAAVQAGFLATTLGSRSPRPNPHELLVLAPDLIVVARDLTAAAEPMTSGTPARTSRPWTGARRTATRDDGPAQPL
jgi:hypothetical protein